MVPDVQTLKDHLDDCLDGLVGSDYNVHIRGFHLMNSTLTPNGPVYEILESYRFRSK